MIKKIHHIGIVVRNLEEALTFYRDALGLHVHKQDVIQDQGVKAALLPLGDSEIELLEPLPVDTGIRRFLESRGEGMHHLCFATDDVEQELKRIKSAGVQVIDQKPRPGLAGMIAFLHPRASSGVLVELAQPPAGEQASAPPLPALNQLEIAVLDQEAAANTYRANFGTIAPEIRFVPPQEEGAQGMYRITLDAPSQVMNKLKSLGIPTIAQDNQFSVDTQATHGVRLNLIVHP